MSRPARKIRLTDPDLELLRFMAEHRLVLAHHAAALLDRSAETASARLTRLVDAGYVRRAAVFRGRPPMFLITGAGLRVLGSELPAPRPDLRVYEHDVGTAWLWLAARAGTFGPLRETIAERRLRSHDGAREPGAEVLGVRLGGLGPRGQERLHYPDLLLHTTDGRRVALELELSSKGHRLETILAGYGADPRIDGVVYLVESAAVARSVQAAARRLGVSSLVHVQRVRLTERSPTEARDAGVTRVAPAQRGRGSARGRATGLPGPAAEAAL